MSLWRIPSCLDRCLKEGFQVALAARKAIGERKAVIGLNTLDGNAFAGKLPGDLAWKVRGGKGALFLVSAQEPGSGNTRQWRCTDTAFAAGRQYSVGVRPSRRSERAGRGIAFARRVWVCRVSSSLPAPSPPSLRITRQRLSTVRVYPRFRIRAHSSTIPSLGFRRCISAMSLSSSGVCWLGWL